MAEDEALGPERPERAEWITIAEAARRLGLAERQARRWAERLPQDARRQEDLGNGRSRALVKLAALRALIENPRISGPDSDRTHDRTSDRTHDRTLSEPEAGAENEAAAGSLALTLAAALAVQRDGFERVLAEQAARISDLQAALDHERTTSQRWQEALAREQMLRALPPPETPTEAPETTGGTATNGSEGLETPTEAPERANRAFWQRAWDRLIKPG